MLADSFRATFIFPGQFASLLRFACLLTLSRYQPSPLPSLASPPLPLQDLGSPHRTLNFATPDDEGRLYPGNPTKEQVRGRESLSEFEHV